MTQTDNSPTATTSARQDLHRVLTPRSVAFVGVSETSPFADSVHRTMQGETEVLFVHPKHDTLFGKPCVPTVADLGRPVDAVFSAVAATHTVDIVRQAASIGAGGVVTVAGGFAEAGETGSRLQEQITDIANAAGMAVVGPNGIGMINVPDRVDLTVLEGFGRRPGGLSVVTHSGAMVEAIAAAAYRPGGAGLNILVSAGNEPVTDLADYLDFFVDDERTRVIALALEKIRRPDAFFAAAARAQEAGKAIVAIKMGRSERGQRMVASHTGSLVGDAWVYEVALRQAGIEIAHEIDELVDRVQFLEQLPAQRWVEVRGLAVLTATGGFAQLASDMAEDTGIEIPVLENLQPFVDENIPGKPVANPLDANVFVDVVPGLWEDLVDRYAADPDVDVLLYASQHADWDTNGRVRAKKYTERARYQRGKPFLLAPLSGIPGQWLGDLGGDGVGVGNGLLGCLRGLQTMGRFVRSRNKGPRTVSPAQGPVLELSDAEVLEVAEGRMLTFAATMRLLTAAGIPVARWAVFDGAVGDVPFAGPYVVKLADVAHRTEHNAVRVNVAHQDLAAVAAELRTIARRDDLPETVAVQEMVSGYGEAFIGLQGASELGPMTVFGLGGVFVEILKKVGGRLAPFDRRNALELVDEVDDSGIMDGFRGAPAWDRERLADVLCAAGDLVAQGREAIESLDINPLIVTADGPVAVDGLCLLQRTN